jgi:hypothetical protein
MYVESEDRLEQPADEVYRMVRDHLPDLVPHLPDVEQVEELSRERESDTRVRVVNRWHAKPTIPALAAKFLPPDVFVWTDRALWKDDEHCVDYKLEGFGYDVDGRNFFAPDGNGTRIKVTATVTIHPERFKIPRLLFNKVFPLLEGTIKKALQPNLTSLSRGLRAYFAEKR